MQTNHQLPDLGFSNDALEPHLSRETLEYHYGKHHRSYVDKLNALIAGTEFAGASLEETVQGASGALYNNAAQHFNHSFYWDCMTPDAEDGPTGALRKAMESSFRSFDAFRERFTKDAVSIFGSGWCWIVLREGGALGIESLPNAGCPLRDGGYPLLTCDVWEHAYYIDYRNERGRYLDSYWNIVNWRFAEERFHQAPASHRPD